MKIKHFVIGFPLSLAVHGAVWIELDQPWKFLFSSWTGFSIAWLASRVD